MLARLVGGSSSESRVRSTGERARFPDALLTDLVEKKRDIAGCSPCCAPEDARGGIGGVGVSTSPLPTASDAHILRNSGQLQ
jgi:hypothetical protein